MAANENHASIKTWQGSGLYCSAQALSQVLLTSTMLALHASMLPIYPKVLIKQLDTEIGNVWGKKLVRRAGGKIIF